MVRITRRDFLKYCSIGAGALGLSASTLMKLEKAYAKETINGGIPVVWIDGAACTGCSMSLLNSTFYTTVDDLLINTLDLNFHKTIMTAAGSPNAPTGTADALTVTRNAYSGADNPTGVPLYVLVVEGGIQCGVPAGTGNSIGQFCKNGNMTNTTQAGFDNETMLYNVQHLASHALAVLSVGTCASFGGIPGAKGSATDSRGTLYRGTQYGKGALLDASVSTMGTNFNSTTPMTNILGMPIKDVTLNISGCPPHPDWIVGTVAHIVSNLPPIATLVGWIQANDYGSVSAALKASLPPVSSYKRPTDYGYREYQCNAGPCMWRYNNTTARAKNTDSYGTWTPPMLITGTNPWPSWTTPGGGAGTFPPSTTYYTAEPDWNPRWPEGDSKALGRNKWTGKNVGCLGILGCKGRKTKADCSRRRWNTDAAENYGVNWCVGSRGACQGCTEPTFPDKVGKFYTFI
jgi:Ni,Fe-hydrogenase I small subunit